MSIDDVITKCTRCRYDVIISCCLLAVTCYTQALSDSGPVFVNEPADKTVAQNSDVLFQCQASGTPKPVIVWKKVDGQIPAERSQLVDSRGLKISSVQSSDEGVYICHAENSVGSREAHARLTVLTQPSFVITPRDKTVSSGQSLVIRCVVIGDPTPTTFWNALNTQTLMFPGQKLESRVHVTASGTLSIQSARVADSGEYSCQALNAAGSSFANAHVTVTAGDELRPPPIIYQGAQNQTLPVDSTALLPCLASGEPAPVLFWLKDTTPLASRDPRLEVLDSGALQIAQLRESDSGSYTCLAVSETGETSWTAHLRVRHPSSPSVVFHRMPDASTFPAAPSRPSVDVATETGVSLSWQPVSDHGASPVISYIVEYYSEHCSEGWTLAATGVSEPRYELDNLRPNTTYMFLVRARNSHGLSLPSPVTEPVRTAGSRRSGVVTSSGHVIRLEDEFPRQQPVEVSVTLNEVKVNLEEVKVINSSCVQLYWQLIGRRAAVQFLRVQYWVVSSSDSKELSRRSALVPVSTECVLDGLEADTRYGLCVQPVYKSGVVGQCSNTRHVYVTQQRNGLLDAASRTLSKSSDGVEPWFIATLVVLTTAAVIFAVVVITVCFCRRRHLHPSKSTYRTTGVNGRVDNAGRQVDIAANRTPLMTSETPANHSTTLYGYHDSRTTPAAYNENKRLFGGVYDEPLSSFDQHHTTTSPDTLHRSSGHVTQQKPMTSSISSNSSIPNPQAYMINPVHRLRSQFNPPAHVSLDTRHTTPAHGVI